MAERELSIEWRASSRKREAVSFLDFPAELKNQVYKHAFNIGDPNELVWINTTMRDTAKYHPHTPTQYSRNTGRTLRRRYPYPLHLTTGLLRVCHQLHAERSSVLYGNIVFILVPWINDSRPDEAILPFHSAYAPLIRNVKFNFWINNAIGGPAPKGMCLDILRVANVAFRAYINIEHLHFIPRFANSVDQGVWINKLGNAS
ncbi:hypothetical protein LTS18_001793 [Coniosporium uncinatum]|uniref:Uncharacterized protein n=1 Tax=Coniosporium uncinatum TaxID=93489 RepID=A0ACC3DUE1_9PEZI|nr:hypothetical protein LTS18_001793 [Coniosporium uncinatum]